jgi:hypothetical protein
MMRQSLLLLLVLGTFSCTAVPSSSDGVTPSATASPNLAAFPAWSQLKFSALSPEGVAVVREPLPRRVPTVAGEPPATPPPYAPGGYSGDVVASDQLGFESVAGRGDAVYGLDGKLVRRPLLAHDEAQAPGWGGDLRDLRAGWLDALIRAWAPDGRLVRTTALDDEVIGNPVTGGVSVCGVMPNGSMWKLYYASESRAEILRVIVNSGSTRLVRTHWGSAQALPVRHSQDEAVRALTGAIVDPASRSWEALNTRDYLDGAPFQPDTVPPYETTEGPTTALYAVPANAVWNARLQQVGDRRVWVLDAYLPAPPSPSPGGYHVLCSGPPSIDVLETTTHLGGLVDADDGTVVRFTRQARVATRQVVSPAPLPTPRASPGSAP